MVLLVVVVEGIDGRLGWDVYSCYCVSIQQIIQRIVQGEIIIIVVIWLLLLIAKMFVERVTTASWSTPTLKHLLRGKQWSTFDKRRLLA